MKPIVGPGLATMQRCAGGHAVPLALTRNATEASSRRVQTRTIGTKVATVTADRDLVDDRSKGWLWERNTRTRGRTFRGWTVNQKGYYVDGMNQVHDLQAGSLNTKDSKGKRLPIDIMLRMQQMPTDFSVISRITPSKLKKTPIIILIATIGAAGATVYSLRRDYPWFPRSKYNAGSDSKTFAVSSYVTRLPVDATTKTVQIRVFHPTADYTPVHEQDELFPGLEEDKDKKYESERYYARSAAIRGCCDARESTFIYKAAAQTLLEKKAHYLQLNQPILEQKKWPVVIFSHGLIGCYDTYSTLCADIARKGYIVCALEHEDGSAGYAERIVTNENCDTGRKNLKKVFDRIYPDPYPRVSPTNKVDGLDKDEVPYTLFPKGLNQSKRNVQRFRRAFLKKRVQEVKDVLQGVKSLEGADASSITLAGHSFGGTTVLEFLRKCYDKTVFDAQARVQGAILYDMWSQPLEYIGREDEINRVLIGQDVSMEFDSENDPVKRSVNTYTKLEHINLPCLFVQSEWFTKFSNEEWWDTQEYASRMTNSSLLVLKSVKHMFFSDVPYWIPPFVAGLGDILRGRISNPYDEFVAKVFGSKTVENGNIQTQILMSSDINSRENVATKFTNEFNSSYGFDSLPQCQEFSAEHVERSRTYLADLSTAFLDNVAGRVAMS